MKDFQAQHKKDILMSKIFIVDDKINNVILLENILEIAGFINIWSTTDERELKEKLEKEKPDLLLLDLMMPHISGFDFLNDRNDPNSNEPFYPVIILTADTIPATKKKALELGASDFLTKPYDFNEVILRVKNHLVTKFLLDQTTVQNEILEEKIKVKTSNLLVANKLAEKNEKKYKLLFEANLDSILMMYVDENGPSDFIECNPASEKNLGYSRGEILSMNIKSLLKNFEFDKYVQIRKKVLEKEKQIFQMEIKRKDDEVRIMETSVIPDELDGKPVAIVFLRDVTDQINNLAAILKQNEIFKEIAWIQSHVVRAPLARMMGIINILEEVEDLDEEVSNYLSIVTNSANELDGIVRKISSKTNEALYI